MAQIKEITLYFLIINTITLLTMYMDKSKAKKGKWRIKESILFILVLLGGGIGGILGMQLFRHKTKKLIFVIGFPLIVIIEILILIYFLQLRLLFTAYFYMLKILVCN